MNEVLERQLRNRIAHALERDSLTTKTASTAQLRASTNKLEREVKRLESTFRQASLQSKSK